MSTTKATAEHARPISKLGTSKPTRRDLPDIDGLAATMALEGLRHPVLITPTGEVLKGGRRVAAACALGWSTIAARTVTTIEEASELIAEQRDEMSAPRRTEDAVDLGLMVETLARRDLVRNASGRLLNEPYMLAGIAAFSSAAQYKRARTLVKAARSPHRSHVVDVAQSCISAVDAGTMTLSGAQNRLRQAHMSTPSTIEMGFGTEGLPAFSPPLPNARSPKARRLRIDWIRALAAKGADTERIAEVLGLTYHGVRRMCVELDIVISADQVLSRTQRKAVDPNRVARVAVDDLDALVFSLDRLDVEALDPEHAGEWSQQLKRYARSIERVARTMKDATTKEQI